MVIRKLSPALFKALGIFLPLITTNCAILGLALFSTNRGYDLVQGLVYAIGAGAYLFHGVQEQSYLYHAMVEALRWNRPDTEKTLPGAD